ncbi:MAG: glycosyltransferase family 4 protein [Patescibacteria group bacterium]
MDENESPSFAKASEGKAAIIIFSTAYLPFVGGAELAIKEITDRIKDYDFFLITARMKKNLPKRERIGNVEVFRVGFGYSFLDKLLSPFWGALVARNLAEKHDVKLFWSMMVTFTSGAPFVLSLLHRLNLWGEENGIPILLTLQEGDSESHLKFSNLGLTGVSWFFAVRMADRIQAISSYLRDYAVSMGARCEIDVVPNGVDLAKFKNQNSKIKITNQNSKIVITVSRLVRKNGMDILVRAIAEVKKIIPDVKLWILGGGAEENYLKKLAQDFKIIGNVEFLGEVPNDRISEYLVKADIFVRPSRSEGLGTAFLEAMAAGLPVIGTPVGGIPDFLKDGENGLFSRPEDAKDLSEKIVKLINNAPFREKIAKHGQQFVLRDYSWDNIAARMKAVFHKVEL